MKELSLTPLMTISLTLTIGIIIAKWGYDDFNMRFWLIISIISCALGSIIFFLTEFLSKKAYFSRSHQFLIFSQCVMIHLCILSLGAFLTCKQIADSQTSTQLKNWQELSYLTRAKINTERYKSNIEKQTGFPSRKTARLCSHRSHGAGRQERTRFEHPKQLLHFRSQSHPGSKRTSYRHYLPAFHLSARRQKVLSLHHHPVPHLHLDLRFSHRIAGKCSPCSHHAFSLQLKFSFPSYRSAAQHLSLSLYIDALHQSALPFRVEFPAFVPCRSLHSAVLLTPLHPPPHPQPFHPLGMGTPLRFTGSPDRNPSGHRLHLRQNIVLFTSHQLHRHSRSNPHPISWSSLNPVLPTHVMGAHSTGCRPTHQPYIRHPDQHHPVFEYSHKTDQHAAWSKHRKRKNQSASGNRSLRYHPAHLCPMAQDR